MRYKKYNNITPTRHIWNSYWDKKFQEKKKKVLTNK